jgi:hypothetical protein
MTQKLILECLADVEERPQRWLWPKRIPAGALSLLVGDPSAGKSTMTSDLIARITTGREWPDGSGAPEPASVIIVQAEEDVAANIKPRLRIAGAAMSHVHVVKGIERRGGLDVWTCADVEPIKAAALERKAALIVIDPLTAFLSGVRDGNDAQQVRRGLLPVLELASSTGASVLGIAHLNKSAGLGQRAMHRISGSHALAAVARAAWLVAEDREDRERRLFLPVKMNLARDVGGMAFRIESVKEEAGEVPRVSWEGPVDLTGDDYLDVAPEQAGRTGEAESWIKAKLAAGPLPAAELRRMAGKEGLGWRTVQRGKERLGGAVESYQAAGEHYWRMVGVDPFGQSAKA